MTFLAVLVCNNTTVKLQVYELLCALCVFSADGMVFAKSVLSHIKVNIREAHMNYKCLTYFISLETGISLRVA